MKKKFISKLFICCGFAFICLFGITNCQGAKVFNLKVKHQKPDTNHQSIHRKADSVFVRLDTVPVFPGGEEAFGKFLQRNIRYPRDARENNATGRLFISFVVEKDGSLTDFTKHRDPGYGLGDEGIRVLKMSPHWAPGILHGKPVRVSYTVPINFSLGDDTFDALHRYLGNPYNYPKIALKSESPEGFIVANFELSHAGLITSASIQKGMNDELDTIVVNKLRSFQTPIKSKSGVYVMVVRFAAISTTEIPRVPAAIAAQKNYIGFVDVVRQN